MTRSVSRRVTNDRDEYPCWHWTQQIQTICHFIQIHLSNINIGNVQYQLISLMQTQTKMTSNEENRSSSSTSSSSPSSLHFFLLPFILLSNVSLFVWVMFIFRLNSRLNRRSGFWKPNVFYCFEMNGFSMKIKFNWNPWVWMEMQRKWNSDWTIAFPLIDSVDTSDNDRSGVAEDFVSFRRRFDIQSSFWDFPGTGFSPGNCYEMQ